MYELDDEYRDHVNRGTEEEHGPACTECGAAITVDRYYLYGGICQDCAVDRLEAAGEVIRREERGQSA